MKSSPRIAHGFIWGGSGNFTSCDLAAGSKSLGWGIGANLTLALSCLLLSASCLPWGEEGHSPNHHAAMMFFPSSLGQPSMNL